MLRIVVYLSLASIFCFLPVSALAGVSEVPGEEPRIVDVPSEEFPTIQSAIDVLPDRSSIRLGPARYTGPLSITGKRINLIGSGAFGEDNTEIVSDDPVAPAITFGPGGGGTLQKLVVRDAPVGIEGTSEVDGEGNVITPLPVRVEESFLHHLGQGIFGDFGDIAVTGSVIHKCDWNGIFIATSKMFAMVDSIISNMENVGALIFNSNYDDEGIIWIINSEFKNNEEGGLAVVGDAQDVEILYCTFKNNRRVGIFLLNAGYVNVAFTGIEIVHLAPVPGYSSDFGDGLVAHSPDSKETYVRVDYCGFRDCDRVGAIFVDCAGKVRYSHFASNKYGLVIQGSPNPVLEATNTFAQNSDEDIVSEGDLPVPDQPLPVPEQPDPPQ